MKKYTWAVIGAGPAGIAAVGQLIKHGVDANSIVWIDPEFKAGDFAKYWSEVSSNTQVKLFKDFLKHCTAFNYNINTELDKIPVTETCKLALMDEPLRIVTNNLLEHVSQYIGTVDKIYLSKRMWHIVIRNKEQINANNVILATGAVPKSMVPPEGIEAISIYDALNPKELAKKCSTGDTVAVFGSSHTAVILLRELLQIGVKEVVNFYREPLRFAVQLEDFILFDDTGLKGNTAIWAREYLNGEIPHGLRRIVSSEENVNQHLPLCTKVIYAIGFQARLPIVEGYPNVSYNPHNGIIAPGLFGVGIAFPESKTDPYGNTELSVGLWKFMTYLDKIVPVWFKYGV